MVLFIYFCLFLIEHYYVIVYYVFSISYLYLIFVFSVYWFCYGSLFFCYFVFFLCIIWHLPCSNLFPHASFFLYFVVVFYVSCYVCVLFLSSSRYSHLCILISSLVSLLLCIFVWSIILCIDVFYFYFIYLCIAHTIKSISLPCSSFVLLSCFYLY